MLLLSMSPSLPVDCQFIVTLAVLITVLLNVLFLLLPHIRDLNYIWYYIQTEFIRGYKICKGGISQWWMMPKNQQINPPYQRQILTTTWGCITREKATIKPTACFHQTCWQIIITSWIGFIHKSSLPEIIDNLEAPMTLDQITALEWHGSIFLLIFALLYAVVFDYTWSFQHHWWLPLPNCDTSGLGDCWVLQ